MSNFYQSNNKPPILFFSCQIYGTRSDKDLLFQQNSLSKITGGNYEGADETLHIP